MSCSQETLQRWRELKQQLGFTQHSQLAHYLLESYFSKVCANCSGTMKSPESPGTVVSSVESLQQLVTLVHQHGQQCSLSLSLQPEPCRGDISYSCEKGHLFLWSPCHRTEGLGNLRSSGDKAAISLERTRLRDDEGVSMVTTEVPEQEELDREEEEVVIDLRTTEVEERREEAYQDLALDGRRDTSLEDSILPLEVCEAPVLQQKGTRGGQRKTTETTTKCMTLRTGLGDNSGNAQRQPEDDSSQINGKRKRKAAQREILPCGFDGCGKIFSTRQYLNHHMKYQHVQQKTFSCSHPACGKSFNFKKHLKEHEKLHSNQRDYICEFCARAFRTSSNLIIHRRIHTGEKPLQCEVCGFTCRQKASLNWHMRKHNTESSYQFSCDLCGRRFEKRDNVTAHRSKSHPDQTSASNTAFRILVGDSQS